MSEPVPQPKPPARVDYESTQTPISCASCDEEFSFGMLRVVTNANGSKRTSDGVFCPICTQEAEEI